jgi:hypothetical protein
LVWHTRSNREEIGTLEDMAVINSNNGIPEIISRTIAGVPGADGGHGDSGDSGDTGITGDAGGVKVPKSTFFSLQLLTIAAHVAA